MRAWLDDRLVASEGLVVSADDPGLLIADGLFETMLVREGRVPFLDDHLERFEGSRRALALPPPPTPPAEAIASILTGNGPLVGEHVLRLTFTARPTLLVTLRHLTDREHRRRLGLDLHLLTARRGECVLARHKSLAWGANAAQRRLHPQGRSPTFEGLWLDPAGLVLEGTSTSLFARIDGVVRTAALTAPILPGVARGRVLRQLTAEGVACAETAFDLEDLLRATEVFATSATLPLTPVRSFDGRALTPEQPAPLWRSCLEALLSMSGT